MVETTEIGHATLLTGDVIECLKALPDDSVHCVVTSPPYWGLRDYGTATWEGGDAECDHKRDSQKPQDHYGSDGKIGRNNTNWDHRNESVGLVCPKCGACRIDKGIGLEPTFQEWLDRMVEVFREVRRVLRKDGTVWLNIGDAYANTCTGGNGATGGRDKSTLQSQMPPMGTTPTKKNLSGFKPKDPLMMPARLAIALQEDGWWVRSEIIWVKPNPMPESCMDRPSSAHEKIYLLTRSARYFYDADAVREEELIPGASAKQIEYQQRNREGRDKGFMVNDSCGTWTGEGNYQGGRNLRNVWTISTQAYPEAHFATFPEALPMKCILAGTSEKGCCPECGAPWKRVVEKVETRIKSPDNWDTAPGGHGKYHREGREKGKVRMGGSGTSFLNHSGNCKADGSSIPQETKAIGWEPTCSCVPPDEVKKHWEPSKDGEEKRRYWTEKIWHDDPPTIPCTILDPFCGSCTTGLVSLKLSRRYIGIDLNPDYLPLRIKRIAQEANQTKMF